MESIPHSDMSPTNTTIADTSTPSEVTPTNATNSDSIPPAIDKVIPVRGLYVAVAYGEDVVPGWIDECLDDGQTVVVYWDSNKNKVSQIQYVY